jgi:hypothetical protein
MCEMVPFVCIVILENNSPTKRSKYTPHPESHTMAQQLSSADLLGGKALVGALILNWPSQPDYRLAKLQGCSY